MSIIKYFDYKVSQSNANLVYKILSGCLPHEKFNIDKVPVVLDSLFKTIPIEETYGILYIFFKALRSLQILQLYRDGHENSLRRERFEIAVNCGVENLVNDELFNISKFLEDYGETYNLDVPEELYKAKCLIVTEALGMYDELFEMCIDTNECETWLNALKEGIELDLTQELISYSARIVTSGVLLEYKLMKGTSDARKYIRQVVDEVESRVAQMRENITDRHTAVCIRSLDDSKLYDEMNKFQIRDLYYTGFEPIDNELCIKTPDIVTIVADEGVGKTRFALDQTYKALMAGNDVYYICSETSPLKIKKQLEAQHIYNMYDIQFTHAELTDFDRIHYDSIEEYEDLIVKINYATQDLYENPEHGKLILQPNIYYEEFYQKIKQDYEAYKFDIVVVDHVLALDSNGEFTSYGRLTNKNARVSLLYQQESVLAQECNIAFINTSHPSTKTSSELANGNVPSKRAGAESSESSKYSSIILIMHSTKELASQDLIIVYVNKLRDNHPISEPLIIQRAGYGNAHTYRKELQHLSNTLDTSNEDALNALWSDEDEELYD